jgi:DNA modification methylase
LQLDVIERCLTLWSNPLETVLTPFMGVGSEAYMAVKMNRKAIGTELKETYFRQAKENLKQAKENEIQEIFNMDFDSEKEEEAEGEES